jgi:MerR family mercuric resistance operon transcriptional regulator
MTGMTISSLARAGGVGVETVRYYQRRGLMPEPERGEMGAVRRYGEAEAKRLRFIRSAQTAGFTLDEIGELIGLDATDDRPRAREMARARIAALTARIEELTAARDALSRLARHCAAPDAGPCPILTAFEG